MSSKRMEEVVTKKSNFEEETKEERIKKEFDRINVFFEKVADNQRAVLTPLLQNAAFMKVTLEDLQQIINEEGVTEVYQNGANQHGIKQSATLQSYNSLIKNYASVIKTLSQMLPYEVKKTDPFTQWEPKEKSQELIEAKAEAEDERRKRIRAEIDLAAARQKFERELESLKAK